MSGDKVITSLLSAVDDTTELALQAIDGGREPSGIYKVVVGMNVEVSNSSLEPLDVRHRSILHTSIRYVKHYLPPDNSIRPSRVHPLHSPSYP